jgi:Ca2+-transporting ATPase
LCSFSNILLVFAAVAAKLPIPMEPLQILWLNLVIHIFPGIALAVTPGGEDLMHRPPRNRNEPLLSWKMLGLLAFKGGMIAGAALLVYVRFLDDLPLARTLVMTTLALCLLLQIFPMLSERKAFFQSRRFFALPLWLAIAGGLLIQTFGLYWLPMGRLLHSIPLPFSVWTAPAVAAVVCIILMEAVKFGIRKAGIRA